jgi:K+-sensing histidine kinase KdpD
MKRIQKLLSNRQITNSFLAVLLVFAMTIPMWLIGRDTLGEAVIALLYLLPVVWITYRFGQLPGISAALSAALVFDFLFIPPFFTFAIARLEGWLVLAIFLIVAVVVVGWIQESISKAREAIFEYELCSALSGARTQEAVAYTLARQIQQLFQSSLVRVTYRHGDPASDTVVSQPEGAQRNDRPDRVIPILNSWGLVGEIQIWRGDYTKLPSEDSTLLQNFSLQAAQAFERTRNIEIEKNVISGK